MIVGQRDDGVGLLDDGKLLDSARRELLYLAQKLGRPFGGLRGRLVAIRRRARGSSMVFARSSAVLRGEELFQAVYS